LANALKTILGFQVANFAFLCTLAWFPLEKYRALLDFEPFLFFFLNNQNEFADSFRNSEEKPLVFTVKGLNNLTKL